MKSKYEKLYLLTNISAFFLILAVPSIFNSVIENIIESVIFLSNLFLSYKYFRLNLKTYSCLFIIIALAFNPVIWVLNSANTFAAMDIISAIGTFLIGLSLQNLIAKDSTKLYPVI